MMPHAAGELVGLLEVLRGQEDRRPALVQRSDLGPDGLAAGRVEAGRGLVEEQHAGLVDQAVARSRRRRIPPE
jgi:hypothetical protein